MRGPIGHWFKQMVSLISSLNRTGSLGQLILEFPLGSVESVVPYSMSTGVETYSELGLSVLKALVLL